jgi:hypothetical protein
MSKRPDPDLAITAWLVDEAPDGASDRLIAATRQQIESTDQRPSWWPARRFRQMNMSIRFVVAAAAVVAVAAAGIYLAPRQGGSGPGGVPSPSLSPSPTAVPQPLSDGPLEAGTVIATGLGLSEATSVTFTVPEGWEGFAGSCVLPVTGTTAPDGMGICFGEVHDGLYSDPCHGTTGPGDIPVGPTVDELVDALTAQTAYEVSSPIDVTLGGYPGKRMDLQLPTDVASCHLGEFYPWAGSIYAQGPDNRWRLWVLDIEGDRLVVFSTDFPGTSPEDRAEQQAIVDTIQIEP